MWQFSAFLQRSTKCFRRLRRSLIKLSCYALLAGWLLTLTTALGQNRTLVEVTPQPLPELPALTNGAQAWGDYDQDGRLDLLVIGQSPSGSVTRLYHNTPAGFEGTILGYPGLAYGSVTWVDYDKDGWLDFMLTGYTGTQSVRLLAHNLAGAGFEDRSELLAQVPGLSRSAVNWTDYDGDGRPDLVVSGLTDYQNPTSAFSQLYLSTPSGFQKASYFRDLPPVSNGSLSSADFNGDGSPDLLITGVTDSAPVSKLYLSTPKGYVESTGVLPGLPGVRSSALATGDYDGDGKPDLMVTGATDSGLISKLYHTKSKPNWNNFELVPTGIPGVKLSASDWGDYDGDGRPDLMITGQYNKTDDNGVTGPAPFSGLYHNTVDGFVDVTKERLGDHIVPLYNGIVAWGDLNGDGRLDLVAGGDQGTGAKSYVRNQFFNTNNSDRAWPSTYTKARPQNFAWELLEYASAAWFPPSLAALIVGELIPPAPPGPLAHGAAQFINDSNLGQSSLFLTGYGYQDDVAEQYRNAPGVQLLVTDNSPKNSTRKTMLESLPVVGVSASDWADFNGDGLLDVSIIGRGGIGTHADPYVAVAWVRLQPNGQAISLPGNPTLHSGTVDWGDYDNDGFPDLLVTGRDVGRRGGTFDINDDYKDYSRYTFLYHNEKGKGFTDATHLLPNVAGLAYSAAAWGDYDNDGRLDLMLTGESASEPVSHLYHNTGAGFEELSDLLPNLPGFNTGTVHWVDYDQDGLLDLFLTGDTYQGPVALLYRNKGLKSLFEETTDQLPELRGLVNGTADWVDYDQDGRLDLLLTGDNGQGFEAKLYNNTPDGFQEVSGNVTALPKVALSATAWGDYDGDGLPDLLITGKRDTGEPASLLLRNVTGELGNSDSIQLRLMSPLYNCQSGAFTFQTSGGDGSPIEYMAPGITAWTTNPNQYVDQGLRQAADAQPITLMARQNGQEVSLAWDIRARCPVGDPTRLQLLAPLYDCQSGAFTFRTQGGDDSGSPANPIEYRAAGITAWTTNPNQYVDQGLRQAADAQPLLLQVRQGRQEDTYVWDLRALCPLTTDARQARQGLSAEPPGGLKAQVYPNPVVDGQVTVVIEGVQDESVRLTVMNLQGQTVVDRQVVVEQARQQESLRLGAVPGGMYLLRVGTARQSQTLKLIKRQ